ncbi:hypothetical protein BGX31_000658 [Mortierella sp. GBA43]|nr:hypothetical protein BGX31_000658 [Mortierella sp. GBA43]
MSMDHMYSHPGDYLPDSQIDDSYEGLLRLSERIGDAKPKGVPTSVMRKMNQHVVSWKDMKNRRRGGGGAGSSPYTFSSSSSSSTPTPALTVSMMPAPPLPSPLPAAAAAAAAAAAPVASLNSASTLDTTPTSLKALSGESSLALPSAPTSLSSSSKAAEDEAVDENCTICLQVYELSDQIRPLPCKHAFHKECIDTWLTSNVQCPICRQEVNATTVKMM